MAKFTGSIYFPDLVGSIGGLTIQENASGNIIRIKPKRSKPNTARQSEQLSIFSELSQSWHQLTRPEQLSWDSFASANPHINLWNQTRTITGFSYFVLCNYNLSQSGNPQITTPPVYTVPTLAASIEITVSSSSIVVELITPSVSVGDTILICVTAPLIAKNFLPRKELRLMKYVTYAGVNTFDVSSEWENYFNLNINDDLYSPVNQVWCAASCFESSTGIASPYLLAESELTAAWSDTLAVVTGATTQYLIYNGAGLPPSIGTTTSLSWSFWYFASNSGLNGLFWYIGSQTYTGVNFLAIRQKSGGILSVQFVGNDGTSFEVDSTVQVIFDGAYHHIVVVIDGSGTAGGVLLIVNGSPVLMTIVSDTLASDITVIDGMSINNITDAATPFATLGAYDEFSVWFGALTPFMAGLLYNGGCPNDITSLGIAIPLQFWWRMGEGSTFPTVLDEQGNWDLTLVGFPNPAWFPFVPCP